MIKAQVLLLAVTVACTAAILVVLWVYIRFGIISRVPDTRMEGSSPASPLGGSGSQVGSPVASPARSTLPRRRHRRLAEVYLAAPGPGPSRPWFFAYFIPLTVRDLAEWIKITNVPGLPVAVDSDKGTYYLPFSGLRSGSPRVLLREPGKPGNDIEVAPTPGRLSPVPSG